MPGKKRIPRKKKKEIFIRFGPLTFDLTDVGRIALSIALPVLQNMEAQESTLVTGKMYAGIKKEPEVVDGEAEIISSKIKDQK